VDVTGSFKLISSTFTRLTHGNRLLQLLVLGWAFPSFIQGVCGFGVPVAVSAPLLVGLGFNPIVAVVTALIGHSWAVTFGSWDRRTRCWSA
jgi:lactate permease